MTNDDKDLNPCPFCGDTKYLRVTYQDSKANASITGDKKYWGVFCMEKCGASIDSIYPTREEAIRVWNTRATPQQPNGYDMDGNTIQYGFSGGSQQPSEKKALSLEDMKKIMWDLENKLGYQPAYETIAQAIHSALPAQREVRYPEKRIQHDAHPERNPSYFWSTQGFNDAIDEFKKLNGG